MNQEPFAQLLRRFRSDDLDIRRSTLAQIDPDSTEVEVEDIAPFLHDDETAVRRLAVSLLGGLQDVAALPALLDTLSDEDATVSAAAETASRKFRNEDAGEIFLAGLQRHEALARAVSASALGELGKTSAIPHLKKAAQDLSPLVRRAAIEALGAFSTDAVEHVLHQGLYDEDDAIRLSTVRLLQARGSRRSIAYLLRTLRDRSAEVKSAGISALEAMADPLSRAHLLAPGGDLGLSFSPTAWPTEPLETQEMARRAA